MCWKITRLERDINDLIAEYMLNLIIIEPVIFYIYFPQTMCLYTLPHFFWGEVHKYFILLET